MDERGILAFNTLADFPTIGDYKYFYFDFATLSLYYWNETVYSLVVEGGAIPITKANQTEVDLGTDNIKYTTPKTIYDNVKWNIHTSGIYSGGVVTINADPTKIDISAGSGYFVDYTTTPGTPILSKVTWSAFTAVAVTYLASSTLSYVGIDSSGAVVQFMNKPTNSQRRDIIPLAQLGHTTLTSVASVVPYTSSYGSPIEQLRDLIQELNLINEGNSITANGANLSINKSSGYLFGLGINNYVDAENPNKKTIASATAPTFRYRTQTGNGANASVLDPTKYDVAGTITTIAGSNNQATNKRVYLFPSGNIVIQYGQVVYSTLQNAISGLQYESFTSFENVRLGGILIAVISVTKGCTALNNTTTAKFIPVSRFGENIGGTTPVPSFQNQLIKQNTDISHTGVTTETIIFNNGFIPAGTFQENDTFRFNIMFGANTNNANNKTGRVYINTTNDLTGSPILIATKTLPSAINATCLRNLVFKNSLTSQQILRPSSNAVTDENLSNALVDLVAIDSTVDLYFIVTGQLATGTDVMGIRSINSEILR